DVGAVADRRVLADARAGDDRARADVDVRAEDDVGRRAAQDHRVVAGREAVVDGDLAEVRGRAAQGGVDRDGVAGGEGRAEGERLARIGADRVAGAQAVGDERRLLVEDHRAGDPGPEGRDQAGELLPQGAEEGRAGRLGRLEVDAVGRARLV